MSIHTGRPSAAGFAEHVHLFPFTGPEYEDAIRNRRLCAGLDSATFTRPKAGSPTCPSAQNRGSRTQRCSLSSVTGRTSCTALNPRFWIWTRRQLRIRSKHSDRSSQDRRPVVRGRADSSGAARRSGASTRQARGNPQTGTPVPPEIPFDSESESPPDVVVVARDRAMNASTHSFPAIWWNHAAIAYATSSAVTAAVTPPPQPESNFAVQISDVQPPPTASHCRKLHRSRVRAMDGPGLAGDPGGAQPLVIANELRRRRLCTCGRPLVRRPNRPVQPTRPTSPSSTENRSSWRFRTRMGG